MHWGAHEYVHIKLRINKKCETFLEKKGIESNYFNVYLRIWCNGRQCRKWSLDVYSQAVDNVFTWNYAGKQQLEDHRYVFFLKNIQIFHKFGF